MKSAECRDSARPVRFRSWLRLSPLCRQQPPQHDVTSQGKMWCQKSASSVSANRTWSFLSAAFRLPSPAPATRLPPEALECASPLALFPPTSCYELFDRVLLAELPSEGFRGVGRIRVVKRDRMTMHPSYSCDGAGHLQVRRGQSCRFTTLPSQPVGFPQSAPCPPSAASCSNSAYPGRFS